MHADSRHSLPAASCSLFQVCWCLLRTQITGMCVLVWFVIQQSARVTWLLSIGLGCALPSRSTTPTLCSRSVFTLCVSELQALLLVMEDGLSLSPPCGCRVPGPPGACRSSSPHCWSCPSPHAPHPLCGSLPCHSDHRLWCSGCGLLCHSSHRLWCPGSGRLDLTRAGAAFGRVHRPYRIHRDCHHSPFGRHPCVPGRLPRPPRKLGDQAQ